MSYFSLACLLAHVTAEPYTSLSRSVNVDIEMPSGDYEEFSVDLTREDAESVWEAVSTDAPLEIAGAVMRKGERMANR